MRRSLAVLVVAAFVVHAAQGLLLASPWLLPDELHAADAARDSVRAGFPSLWALLTWPMWAIGDDVGYEGAKLVGAAAVALAALPAYALARLVAPERAALVAAGVAALAPETVLASTAHPVAVAYPVAAAATLWAVTGSEVRAALAGAVAVALWPPLAFAALPVAFLLYVRRVTPRGLLEWPAAAALAAVPAAAYALVAGGRVASAAFRAGTGSWDEVPFAAGASVGALALGLGVVPLVLGIAALADRAGGLAMSRLVAVTAVEAIALALLAGVLALGRGQGRDADELALLPVVPPLLAVAAGSLAGVAARTAGIVALAVAVAVLLVPSAQGAHAPGLALADAFGLGTKAYALALLLVGLNVAGALWLFRRHRIRELLPLALTLVAVALVVPGELAAWTRARDVPDVPHDVGRAAGGRFVNVLSAGASRELVNSFLFWTPTAAVARPPLEARRLDPATGAYDPPLRPGLAFDFAGARIAGRAVLRTPVGVLIDAGASPRAAETIEGLYPDTWSGGEAHYRRFGGATAPGVLLVSVSRAGWHGPSKRAQVVIDAVPTGGDPYAERISSIDSGQTRTIRVPVPPPPFDVKVAIGPTFSPADYGGADQRQLGAQLAFDYRPGA